MDTEYLIRTIDTHTAGEPTRIVTGGLGWSARGQSVREQSERFAEEYGWARELLMQEPRGHRDMFGAVPVEPAGEDDLGLVFLTHDGVGELCGHALIAVITAFIETGRLDPSPEIRVETAVGTSVARPGLEGDRVARVAVETPPAFVYDRVSVPVAGHADVPVDIVYAGIFFALVDASEVDLGLEGDDTDEIVDLGLQIRRAVNDAVDVVHPLTGQARRVLLTQFYTPSRPVERDAVVLAGGSIDRSPCGTGTCARMVLLHDRGELDVGDTYRVEGPVGTQFEGRLLETEERRGRTMTRPEVVGSAYVIRTNRFTYDPSDPLTGFAI